jgi:hypothetical protein
MRNNKFNYHITYVQKSACMQKREREKEKMEIPHRIITMQSDDIE